MNSFAFFIAAAIVVAALWAWISFGRKFFERQDFVLCIADSSRGNRDFRNEKAQARAAVVPLLSFSPGGIMNTALNGSFGHGMIDGKKQKLVMDLKGVLADADDLLKEVANSTAEEFAAICTKVEDRVGDARGKLDEARISVLGKAQGAADYVSANPGKSLGAAIIAGLVIGAVISRR